MMSVLGVPFYALTLGLATMSTTIFYPVTIENNLTRFLFLGHITAIYRVK